MKLDLLYNQHVLYSIKWSDLPFTISLTEEVTAILWNFEHFLEYLSMVHHCVPKSIKPCVRTSMF